MIGKTRGLDLVQVYGQQRVEDDGVLQSSQQELSWASGEPL